MTVTVLDGGMGGEIQKRISNSGKGLWSARALIEKPQIVVDLHREYIEAGARMIITNTYSTIPSYLAKENLQAEYVRLTRLAGKLARQTVETGSDKVLVAGSIPPLSESYRPDLVPARDSAMPVYQNMVEALQPFVEGPQRCNLPRHRRRAVLKFRKLRQERANAVDIRLEHLASHRDRRHGADDTS